MYPLKKSDFDSFHNLSKKYKTSTFFSFHKLRNEYFDNHEKNRIFTNFCALFPPEFCMKIREKTALVYGPKTLIFPHFECSARRGKFALKFPALVSATSMRGEGWVLIVRSIVYILVYTCIYIYN